MLGEATSDADGRFRVKWRVNKVSAVKNTSVECVILVIKDGCAIQFRETTLWRDNYNLFTLIPDVVHEGQVLDDQGKPLADAEVRLDAIYRDVDDVDRGVVFCSEDRVCSMMTSALRPRVKTDQEGRYQMRGLASGQIVLLQVTHPRFPAIRRMQPVDSQSPKSIRERTDEHDRFGPWYNSYGKPMQMSAGKLGSIVAIEDETGKPLADLEVCRFFSGESAKSDQDGKLEYWLPMTKPARRGVANSEYYARRAGDRFWSFAFISDEQGDGPTQLVVPQRRTITGFVRDKTNARGIEGVAVYFLNSGEKGWTFTDRDGRYSLSTYSELSTIVLGGQKWLTICQ